LVSTATSLLRITSEYHFTHLDRCCHLIFDDANLTFESHGNEVAQIMRLYRDAHVANREMLDQERDKFDKLSNLSAIFHRLGGIIFGRCPRP
jgi:hypothetical protein